MSLTQLLELKTKDIISCVGSGGKTSLIFALANELRREKVLVTTTTKMFKPTYKVVDYLLSKEQIKNFQYNKGITYLYDSVNNENKVYCSEDTINSVIDNFDFTIIESDGSKRKPLKAWQHGEPVIINRTTKTVGIIPIQAIGMEINDDNIHRFQLFQNSFNLKNDKYIDASHLTKIIFHENGLFKDALGERILFINGIDGEKELDMAQKLLEKIAGENNKFSLKIIGGTLKSLNFFKF